MKSIDQIRNLTWASHAEAVKDLKRRGFKDLGADYIISETSPGSNCWHIADRTEAAEQEAPAEPVTAEQEAPAKRKRAAHKRAAEPEPEPEPVKEPSNDMTPLPNEGGPYSLGAADPLPQHSIVQLALDWSVKVGERVVIHAKGKAVRIMDGRIGKPPRMNPGRSPKGTGKNAEVVKLLFREQGATKTEMMQITEWSFAEKYIRQLAKTHKAEMVVIAKDHWRLIKD